MGAEFSKDETGEVGVVDFSVLDAHDAAMALALVRSALALTKQAASVIGVVVRGGRARAYMDGFEGSELLARRWDGATLRAEPDRVVATARCERSSLRAELARLAAGESALGGPVTVALAACDDGGGSAARVALHLALEALEALERRSSSAAAAAAAVGGEGAAARPAALDREDLEAALHAFHERVYPAAGRRGWDAPEPAKFDRSVERWTLRDSGPPPLLISKKSAGWQNAFGCAKVRLSKEAWLQMHGTRLSQQTAAEDSEDLAALTDPSGNRWTLYAQATTRSSTAASSTAPSRTSPATTSTPGASAGSPSAPSSSSGSRTPPATAAGPRTPRASRRSSTASPSRRTSRTRPRPEADQGRELARAT